MIHYSYFFLATNVYEIMTLWTTKDRPTFSAQLKPVFFRVPLSAKTQHY